MTKEKFKIAIIGKGNVGSHLFKALSPLYDCILINSRQREVLHDKVDLALICVKDDAIKEVAESIEGKAHMIAHTSGSIGLDVLNERAEMTGVFYPLQTFNKDLEMDYSEIPFFIEGDSEKTSKILETIAGKVSSSVIRASSEKRRKLHLASVFACNFTNAMVAMADSVLKDAGMDYKILLPLLNRTINKLNETDPHAGQTGPAVRNDRNVIDKHMKMLEEDEDMQKTYEIITRYIINSHKS